MLPVDSFDHVIETTLDGDLLARMIDVVRPRGPIVLKSRHTGVLPLDVSRFLRSRRRCEASITALFHKAVALLVEGQLAPGDWFGETFALEDFADAMARDEGNEAAKLFLTPGNTHVRTRC